MCSLARPWREHSLVRLTVTWRALKSPTLAHGAVGCPIRISKGAGRTHQCEFAYFTRALQHQGQHLRSGSRAPGQPDSSPVSLLTPTLAGACGRGAFVCKLANPGWPRECWGFPHDHRCAVTVVRSCVGFRSRPPPPGPSFRTDMRGRRVSSVSWSTDRLAPALWAGRAKRLPARQVLREGGPRQPGPPCPEQGLPGGTSRTLSLHGALLGTAGLCRQLGHPGQNWIFTWCVFMHRSLLRCIYQKPNKGLSSKALVDDLRGQLRNHLASNGFATQRLGVRFLQCDQSPSGTALEFCAPGGPL